MDRPRILIVDDEPDARDTLAALLFHEGYDITFAADGPEALAAVKDTAPDAILLDVMMPGMDGLEVCRCLRADPLRAEVPIILVTALDDRDSRLRGIKAGADGFMTKPVDGAELRARVRTITRLNRYRRPLWERDRRLEAEEKVLKRDGELTLLSQIIVATASTFDTNRILETACESLADALDVPHSAASLTDWEEVPAAAVESERSRRGHPASATGLYALLPLIAARLGPLEQAPVAVVDVEKDPRLASLRKELHDHGIVSLLMVPVIVHDRLAGSIILGTVEQRRFTELDCTLAQSVASAVGQALDSSRLYYELQRRAEDLVATVAQRTLELQVERDRTQAILEAVGEAVVVTDVDGFIQYMNPAAVALTGFSSDEAKGQQWSIWQGQTLLEGYDALMEEVKCSGQNCRGEAVHKRRDGTLHDVAVTVAPLREPDCPRASEGRDLAGFVSVERDITPIKAAERMKDEFVSNVSHELRTPLSVITLISGNLDTLYSRLDDGKRQQMIQEIREHARVLNDLIQDILETSRIDSQRISMERQILNLADLASSEADKQLPLARQKRQSLLLQGARELPVWGNEGQLRQAIRNVLNNAIKYTPPDGQIVCKGLVTEANAIPSSEGWEEARESQNENGQAPPQDQWVALRVIDNGPGISENDLRHVFNRFYRADSQKEIPGTGLGLSIASELVELHGGHLTVTSAPGEGSTFSILLPLKKGRDHEHEGA